jgi:hypothetical protein
MHLMNLIVVFGVIAAAAAVSLTCAVGLVVWLAGGRLVGHGKDRRHA